MHKGEILNLIKNKCMYLEINQLKKTQNNSYNSSHVFKEKPIQCQSHGQEWRPISNYNMYMGYHFFFQ